jgi:hypothetical protein
VWLNCLCAEVTPTLSPSFNGREFGFDRDELSDQDSTTIMVEINNEVEWNNYLTWEHRLENLGSHASISGGSTHPYPESARQ